LARKILLADDSVTAQNMGRRILSDAGYDVTTVNNGSAALKKIAESKPDLIVLDVYMPGYGGLEVCQRLREAPETARIPVLLTVGKLEPFKAEEARRVRADGFIVKPFEASELLTALTKLEDKIVPQSQPAKPSRFAKALAGAEDFASGKEFGDSETGWKNRLSIPPPQSKHRGAPPAEVREASSDRDVASYPSTVPRTEEQKPAEMKSGLEEALLSSLPQDVTPEEIAAIKAAAAAFNAPADESSFAPHRNYVEDPTPAPVATAETQPQASGSESISVVPQAESLATAEPTTIADAASAGDVPPETVPPPVAIVADSQTSPAFQAADAEAGKLADDEVTAALASLAPTNGHGDTAIDREVDRWESAARDRDQDQVPVTMAVADAAQGFSGPRWIAEAVPLRDDEATLILEQEMEKAFAAFAAADAARMSFVSSPEPVAPVQMAEAPAFNSEAAYSPVEPVSNSESSESEPQEPMVADTAVISNEGSSAPESELNAVADSPSVDAVSDNVVPEVKEIAAYAAAASAGSSTVDANIDAEAVSHATPMAESAETAPAAPEPGEGRGESELVAAWANWKQIRESVIGSQLTSQIADTVAELKETSIETQPEPQVDTAPATEEDSSEISNIVDSVLADLKPKLMAEIAKKMGKDKKK
jgi:CheY-like chemotaxis protein